MLEHMDDSQYWMWSATSSFAIYKNTLHGRAKHGEAGIRTLDTLIGV